MAGNLARAGPPGRNNNTRTPPRLRDDTANVGTAANESTECVQGSWRSVVEDNRQIRVCTRRSISEDDVKVYEREVDYGRRGNDRREVEQHLEDLFTFQNDLYEPELRELGAELEKKRQELGKMEHELKVYREMRKTTIIPFIVPISSSGWWGSLVESYARRKTLWWVMVWLVVLLIGCTLLGVLLRPGPKKMHPRFIFPVEVTSTENTTIDITLQLDRPGMVYFAISPLPSPGAVMEHQGLLQGAKPRDIVVLAKGHGSAELKGATVGCGGVWVSPAVRNYTISVTSMVTKECKLLRARAASGEPVTDLCLRCPLLVPATSYLVVIVSQGRILSPVQSTQVCTPGPETLKVPVLLQPVVITNVTGGGFDFSFRTDKPGFIQLSIFQQLLYARFFERYVVFENVPAVDELSGSSSFRGALVAQGTITVDAYNTTYTCRVDSRGLGCTCDQGNPCTLHTRCFGGLCDYSNTVLSPSTPYKVAVFTRSQVGDHVSGPIWLPTFTTPRDTTAPLLDVSRVEIMVSEFGFTIGNISLDKMGQAVVVVTRPKDQSLHLASGTASQLQLVERPLSPGPRLLTEDQPLVKLVGLEPIVPGSIFLPPQRQQIPCNQSVAVFRYVVPAQEDVMDVQCLDFGTIRQARTSRVNNLENDTLYHVKVVVGSVNGDRDLYLAHVKTIDLRPPTFIKISTASTFSAIQVTVALDEPAVVYGAAVPLRDYDNVKEVVGCPPTFQGGGAVSIPEVPVVTANREVAVVFGGLTANSVYKILLIARDPRANCQKSFTYLDAATDDDIPPEWMTHHVQEVTGSSAKIVVSLNEPSTVFFSIVESTSSSAVCPSAPQIFSLTPPPGTIVPLNGSGSFTVPSAQTKTMQVLSDLMSETRYTACLVAEDTTPHKNRQTHVKQVTFTTLDITPPAIKVALLPGKDGNVTCSRESYMCTVSYNMTIDEDGVLAWVVVNASTALTSITAPSLLTGQLASITGNKTFQSDKAIKDIPVTARTLQLPHNNSYTLLVAASDSQGNVNTSMVAVTFSTPDVRPPEFTQLRLTASSESMLTVSATMDEAGHIVYVVMPAQFPVPSPQDARAGLGKDGLWGLARGEVDVPSAGVAVPLAVGPLSPATFYDVHLVARDRSDNWQQQVTTLPNVRTVDDTPPLFNVTATFKAPMTFNLITSLSEPGTLFYSLYKQGTSAPASSADVTEGGRGNYSSQVQFTSGYQMSSTTLCVADGDKMDLYVVAADNEGQMSGRTPNFSPVQRVDITILPLASSGSCSAATSLSAMQPIIDMDKPGEGWVSGHLRRDTRGTPQSLLQDVRAWTGTDVESTATVKATSPWFTTPTSFSQRFKVSRAPPAKVAFILRTPTLILEEPTSGGGVLSFSYQLQDSRGRSRVSRAEVGVTPVLRYNSTPPTNLTQSNNLASCDVTLLDDASGVGECSLVLPSKYFSSSIPIAASLSVVLSIGSTNVATAAAVPLSLLPSPPRPAFVPASGAGILVTLPYRPLYPGEAFLVTVAARITGNASLTNFVVPLWYDPAIIELQDLQPNSMWELLPVVESLEAIRKLLKIGSSRRSPTASVSSYKGSAVVLVDLTFVVVTKVAKAYRAIGIATDVMDPTWKARLIPYGVTTDLRVHDFRSGAQTEGFINVVGNTPLGIWAFAAAYDVFNTALFSGTEVLVPVRTIAVNSWGDAGQEPTTEVTAESCSTGASTSMSVSCSDISVSRDHKVPVKDAEVDIAYQSFSTRLFISVWIPSDLKAEVDDTVLNSILPVNVLAGPPCLQRYQSTRVRGYASFTNGGNARTDTTASVDVTSLVRFTSSDRDIVRLASEIWTGGPHYILQGLTASTRPATISMVLHNLGTSPSVSVTVSDASACLERLVPVAATGVLMTADPTPGPNVNATVTLQPRQDLTWEGATAMVLTYAQFSDGTTVELFDAEVATSQAGLDTLPFALSPSGSAPPILTVTAKVGSASTCGEFLTARWEACSIEVGSGLGVVNVALPKPTAIASVLVDPPIIASTLNPAALDPLLMPIKAVVVVTVSFQDNSVHDFTFDNRTTVLVKAATSLCSVSRDPTSYQWTVMVPRAAAFQFGSCVIQAEVNFSFRVLKMNATVEVRGLRALQVFALEGNAGVVPPSRALLPASPVSSTLQLFKCDYSNYEQRTLWVMGQLSNCSDPRSCELYDLNAAHYSTSIASTVLSVAAIQANPAYAPLDNRLVPLKAGSTVVNAAYRDMTYPEITVLVLDVLQQPGSLISASEVDDVSYMLQAKLTVPAEVIYQVLPATSVDYTSGLYTPRWVEEDGTALSADPNGTAFTYQGTVTKLLPATNYTAFFAIRVGLDVSPTVHVLEGILTRDRHAPTFTNIKLLSNTTTSATFEIRLDVALNEAGKVAATMYLDKPCRGTPTVRQVMDNQEIPAALCTCEHPIECRPVAHVTQAVVDPQASETITISGSLPPSPWEYLRNAGIQRCSALPSVTYADSNYRIFLVAEDDTPSYKSWNLGCDTPVQVPSPPGACNPLAKSYCNNTRGAEAPNIQTSAWQQIDLASRTAREGADFTPLTATVPLKDSSVPAFSDVVTTITEHTVIFKFRMNKPGLVSFLLTHESTEVAQGFLATFDTAQVYTVPISLSCQGVPLSANTPYVLWYQAWDTYGTRSTSSQRVVSIPAK